MAKLLNNAFAVRLPAATAAHRLMRPRAPAAHRREAHRLRFDRSASRSRSAEALATACRRSAGPMIAVRNSMRPATKQLREFGLTRDQRTAAELFAIQPQPARTGRRLRHGAAKLG